MAKCFLSISSTVLTISNIMILAKIGHWIIDLVWKVFLQMLILSASGTAANWIAFSAHSDITSSSSQRRINIGRIFVSLNLFLSLPTLFHFLVTLVVMLSFAMVSLSVFVLVLFCFHVMTVTLFASLREIQSFINFCINLSIRAAHQSLIKVILCIMQLSIFNPQSTHLFKITAQKREDSQTCHFIVHCFLSII